MTRWNNTCHLCMSQRSSGRGSLFVILSWSFLSQFNLGSRLLLPYAFHDRSCDSLHGLLPVQQPSSEYYPSAIWLSRLLQPYSAHIFRPRRGFYTADVVNTADEVNTTFQAYIAHNPVCFQRRWSKLQKRQLRHRLPRLNSPRSLQQAPNWLQKSSQMTRSFQVRKQSRPTKWLLAEKGKQLQHQTQV